MDCSQGPLALFSSHTFETVSAFVGSTSTQHSELNSLETGESWMSLFRWSSYKPPMFLNRLHRGLSAFNHADPSLGSHTSARLAGPNHPEAGLKVGRLGKVAMSGLKPDEIEVLQPGLIDRPWNAGCAASSLFNTVSKLLSRLIDVYIATCFSPYVIRSKGG